MPRITSPDLMPASCAGELSCASATSAPLLRFQAQAVGDLVGDRLDLHADPAARDRALVLQRGDDRLGGLGRDGEADADAAAGRREDRGVDADDLAFVLKVGPPELPRLTGASICRKSS